MSDVPMLPMRNVDIKDVQMTAVHANQMTIAQQQMVHAIWQSIQPARQDQKITALELRELEASFNSHVSELNNAYRRISNDTEGGMKFLYEHIHGINIQASQFSSLVRQ